MIDESSLTVSLWLPRAGRESWVLIDPSKKHTNILSLNTTGNFYKDSWMGGFSSWQDQKKWRQVCQKKLKAVAESAVDAKRLRTTCFPSKHCPGKWINTRGAQLTEFSLRKLNSLGWICIVVSEQLWLLVSSAQSPGWQALAITTEVTWAKQIHKYVVNEL